jgi:hypothetical protein
MSYKLRNGKVVKTKKFTMKREQIPEMVDAIFYGNPDKPGWVEMYVNGKGREAVNALFPKAVIEWRPLNEPGHGYDPANLDDGVKSWETFELHLPSVAEHPPNNLVPVNGDQPLSQSNQVQLAFVLAISAKHQGARAAWDDHNGNMYIVTPPVN